MILIDYARDKRCRHNVTTVSAFHTNIQRYDIPTDGYGGPELNPAYVEIEISSSIGATEPVVMFLKTDDLQ